MKKSNFTGTSHFDFSFILPTLLNITKRSVFLWLTMKVNHGSRADGGFRCELFPYISPVMYSSLFVTVALASSKSCFTKTGPISL